MSLYSINDKQVKKGMIGEELIKYYLCNIKQETFINFNNTYEYDIKTNKGTYEIKTDSNYIKFNSVFCEFLSNNKKSGINTTNANFYIFVCPNNNFYEINYIYEIEINVLKILIEKYEEILVIKNAPCRDYKNNIYSLNMGYIIPEYILNEYAIKYTLKLDDYEDLYKLIRELI
jgi:hypothetical protein